MSADQMFPPVPAYYDPVTVFAEVFADTDLAGDLAEALTCSEVNVLAGLLACRDPRAAEAWLEEHRQQCPTPHIH
jgi:hypothetical protein